MGVKVSVLTTTYNHEHFIAQAIESVLVQETEFVFEHVIGEDCSTDRTREIVVDYQRRYPDRIRLLLRERNFGGRENLVETLRACQGEYIAMLEGDDYWTSPYKLQKQVDFLETHPECALCFHGATKQYEADAIRPRAYRQPAMAKTIYTLDDLLERNFIRTCTVMFRNGLLGEIPPWIYTTPMADWPLHILNAQHGDVGYIDEVMAVHRVHGGGVWSTRSVVERRREAIRALETIRAHLGQQHDLKIERSIARWHFKVLNGYLLGRQFRGAVSYAWKMLVRGGVSKTSLLRAAIWALRSRGNQAD